MNTFKYNFYYHPDPAPYVSNIENLHTVENNVPFFYIYPLHITYRIPEYGDL